MTATLLHPPEKPPEILCLMPQLMDNILVTAPAPTMELKPSSMPSEATHVTTPPDAFDKLKETLVSLLHDVPVPYHPQI